MDMIKAQITTTAPGALLAMAALSGVSACAPAHRANLDVQLAGQLVWPAPPEKPRISYLWSLYSFAPEGRDLSGYLGADGQAEQDGELPIMLKPYGVTVDARDNLFVVDQGIPRVSRVNMQSREVMHFGYDGIGKLLMPIAVAVDAAGSIYVTDSEAGAVNIYAPSGSFAGHLGDEGLLKRPTGIAIDRNSGRIYVLDTAEHKTLVFDRSGKHLFDFGKRGSADGEFNYPTHIAIGPDGRVYINDAMNFRVQLFTPDGAFIRTFGNHGDTYADIDKAKGIAVDTLGHIYLVDAMQDMVKIFDDQGRLLLFFGENGKTPGRFSLPSGIAIDGQNRIYVADTYNLRVQAFRLIEENVR